MTTPALTPEEQRIKALGKKDELKTPLELMDTAAVRGLESQRIVHHEDRNGVIQTGMRDVSRRRRDLAAILHLHDLEIRAETIAGPLKRHHDRLAAARKRYQRAMANRT